MTTTTIKALLKAALFTGAICVLPNVALADGQTDGEAPTSYEEEGQTTYVESQPAPVASQPTQVEVQVTAPEGGATYIPDHAEAQARGARNDMPVGRVATTGIIPDHAEAQARGAGDDDTGLSAALPFPGTIPDHGEAEREIDQLALGSAPPS